MTFTRAVIGGHVAYLTVEELQFPLAIGLNVPVYFADDEDD